MKSSPLQDAFRWHFLSLEPVPIKPSIHENWQTVSLYTVAFSGHLNFIPLDGAGKAGHMYSTVRRKEFKGNEILQAEIQTRDAFYAMKNSDMNFPKFPVENETAFPGNSWLVTTPERYTENVRSFLPRISATLGFRPEIP